MLFVNQLTEYTMDQKSMLEVIDHGAADLCSMSIVKTADSAPPIQFNHAVSDNAAGYFFNVDACRMYHIEADIQLATIRIDPFIQFS